MKYKYLLLLFSCVHFCTAWAETEKPQPQTLASKNWSLLVKASQIYNIHNQYSDQSGVQHMSTASASMHLMGIGVAYDYDLNEIWKVFPEYTLSQYLKNDSASRDELTIGVLSLNLGYTLGQGQLSAGLLTSQVFSKSDLSYSPSMGVRFGYTYHLDKQSSVSAGFDFIVLKSENKNGNVYNQDTEMRMLTLTYGYRI